MASLPRPGPQALAVCDPVPHYRGGMYVLIIFRPYSEMNMGKVLS